MNFPLKDIYVLGTGLSHDGSACLLKNGKICYAIEKERISRLKHDGYNDSMAIDYCLKAANITINDLSLVVQNANFGFFEFGNSHFFGERLFNDSIDIPIVTISHHLAHAYYAIGTSPFEETAILVMDGCGSLFDECIDIMKSTFLPEKVPKSVKHLFAEKDSFYEYSSKGLDSIFKDFSPFGYSLKNYPFHPPTTKHSIGGLYSAASTYCFQNDFDSGKLMGLAPYGKPNIYFDEIFELKDDRVFVNYEWMQQFRSPARSEHQFWRNFQYYADIAYWVQKETERAILYIAQSRSKLTKCKNLSYTGGVALNAVANSKLRKFAGFDNYYITPAAGDNGLAIGCAYYGWLEILKKGKIPFENNSCYGKSYTNSQIEINLKSFSLSVPDPKPWFINSFFEQIDNFVEDTAISQESYSIRIIISKLIIYDLLLKKGVGIIKDRKNLINSPDCIVETDCDTFLRGLSDQNLFLNSIRANTTSVGSNIEYFLDAIKWEGLLKHINYLQSQYLENNKIRFTKETEIVKKTAQLLADGNIIGWFQGGSEFGPRALGHRSILADPRKPDVQKFINNKIKFREDFRPFAPSILKDRVAEYFEIDDESPYMLIVSEVKKEAAGRIPGVIHLDNSARIQTVAQEKDPMYYDLIKTFDVLTGIPILLNTSFNKRGMPIVETPDQALTFFFECELDYLIIGDFIVYKD